MSCMCVAMTLLYGAVLFVLEFWFGCDIWFKVGASMGIQGRGLNICSQFPLSILVEIWMFSVGHVFCCGFVCVNLSFVLVCSVLR